VAVSGRFLWEGNTVKKSTKGAVAASAAALLLLGGAGTQAGWTGDADAAGTAINAGHLELVGSDCLTTDWLLGAVPFDPATMKIVPGTLLTKKCTFTINIAGAGLTATLGTSAPTWSNANDLAATLDVGSSFAVDGGGPAISTVTEADNGTVVEATLTVELPADADNSVQTLTTALNDIAITASQS
jgi:alternate signal-mediated exported protein